MKFVSALTEEEQIALTQLYQTGNSHRQRQRAHGVLLSAQGYSITQLAELFTAKRDTVSRWLTTWQQTGILGLADAPKSGRPRKVTQEVEAVLLDLLEHPTPALKTVIEAELQKKTSRSRGTR